MSELAVKSKLPFLSYFSATLILSHVSSDVLGV